MCKKNKKMENGRRKILMLIDNCNLTFSWHRKSKSCPIWVSSARCGPDAPATWLRCYSEL